MSLVVEALRWVLSGVLALALVLIVLAVVIGGLILLHSFVQSTRRRRHHKNKVRVPQWTEDQL